MVSVHVCLIILSTAEFPFGKILCVHMTIIVDKSGSWCGLTSLTVIFSTHLLDNYNFVHYRTGFFLQNLITNFMFACDN